MNTQLIVIAVLCTTVGAQTWGAWANWGPCSVTCAGGDRSRSRVNSFGATEINSANCNNVPCPINGGWENWESWISCSKTCGGGVTSRKRSCDAPSPAFGGTFCKGGVAQNIDIESVEFMYKTCNEHPCEFGPVLPADPIPTLGPKFTTASPGGAAPAPVDPAQAAQPVFPSANGGPMVFVFIPPTTVKPDPTQPQGPVSGSGWGEWAQWGECSASCAGGDRTRQRIDHRGVIEPHGENCNNIPCPIHGGWENWGSWISCSKTCGGGVTSRRRGCDAPTPAFGGNFCEGGIPQNIDSTSSEFEWKTCNTHTCEGGGIVPPPEVIPTLSPNVTTASPASESLNATVKSTNSADQGIPVNKVSQPSTASGQQPVSLNQHVTTTGTMELKQPQSHGGVSPPQEVIPTLSPDVTTASPVSESLNATVNSTNTADQGISANIVSQQSLASGKQPVLPDKPVTTTATMDPEQPQPHGAEVSPPLEVITALSPNVATMSPVSKSQNATVNSANTAQDISANRVNHPSTASGRQPVLPDQHVSTLVTTAMTPKQPPAVMAVMLLLNSAADLGALSNFVRLPSLASIQQPIVPARPVTTARTTTTTISPRQPRPPVSGSGWGEWTQWGECSASCAGGDRSRSRIDDRGAVEPHAENCNNIPCPIDGGWENWESWTSCTRTCGGGVTSRERTCDAPVPDFGGKFCVGGNPCNIDIEGVEWDWKTCNEHPCEEGGLALAAAILPTLAPDFTTPSSAAVNCVRPAVQEIPVSSLSPSSDIIVQPVTTTIGPGQPHPPVSGSGWGEWTQWGECSASCAGGDRTRSRIDDRGAIEPNSENCNNDACPIDGGWENWGSWISCSRTCGGGVTSRGRKCDAPVPEFGGKFCVGDNPNNVDKDGVEWMWETCNELKCEEGGNVLPPDAIPTIAPELTTARTAAQPVTTPATVTAAQPVLRLTAGNHGRQAQPQPQPGARLSLPELRGRPSHNVIQPPTTAQAPLQPQVDAHGFGPWTDWSGCTRVCGGSETRFKVCQDPRRCWYPIRETRSCDNPCPVYNRRQPFYPGGFYRTRQHHPRRAPVYRQTRRGIPV